MILFVLILFQALEEHGILKQIRRFAGTSIGSICAALYAVGFNSHDVEQIMSVNLETLVSGKRMIINREK